MVERDSGRDPTAELRRELVRAVRAVCPGWLADCADDLVQVALLRLLERGLIGEGTAPLGASYLRRVAYCALVDEIRRRGRRREAGLEEAGGEVPSPDRVGPLEAASERELARALRECLSLLVVPRRLALTLHLAGHTVPEAAKLLGWGAKRTENLVYRGLADLRTCLARKGWQG